jgi:ornithine cyclodeaminase/alanine dehydrogenase-like protein (mu-crystallin family)
MIYISEPEMEKLVTMGESIAALEDLFRAEAAGNAEQKPTIELHPGRGMYRLKAGGTYWLNSFGFKGYGSGGRRLVFLFGLNEGLQAIMDAEALTQSRTAAVSAVATKYLAREDASTMGIIGTGFEARSEVDAVHHVRKLKHVKAYSRNPENREAFAAEMTEKLGIPVEAVDSGEECVRDVDIITTATSASEPVLFGAWLKPGVHINAIGATTPYRRELDDDAVAKCDLVVVESLPTAQGECGELLSAASKGRVRWSMVRELKDIVTGVYGRKRPEDITMVSTIGTGAEDVAIGHYVYQKALAAGLGTPMPNWPDPSTGRGSTLTRAAVQRSRD